MYKIEVLKYPTDEDWFLAKQCALNTTGKNCVNMPTDEWKIKLLESEHSPIRPLLFAFKMEIPYWMSVHFVRHKIGVEHFVSSQRNDRQFIYDRNKAPQNSIVSHIMVINAQELVNMSHIRLCKLASEETREVMKLIVEKVLETNPEFKSVLVPKCIYRNGKCTEMFPCNKGDINAEKSNNC